MLESNSQWCAWRIQGPSWVLFTASASCTGLPLKTVERRFSPHESITRMGCPMYSNIRRICLYLDKYEDVPQCANNTNTVSAHCILWLFFKTGNPWKYLNVMRLNCQFILSACQSFLRALAFPHDKTQRCHARVPVILQHLSARRHGL